MKQITGNTYPVRLALRAMGGQWNKGAQAWDIPDEKAEEARALVATTGPARTPTTRQAHRRVNTYRFAGGGTMTQNARGRCEDAPCCGCCT